MDNIELIAKKILRDAKKCPQDMSDMCDLANIIGAIIAEYAENDPEVYEDFLAGLNHGISIVDGTHDKSIQGKYKFNKKHLNNQSD